MYNNRYSYDIRRKTLVLSDRREHCLEMVRLANEKYRDDIAGAYLGGMKIHELDESNKKMIICATYQEAPFTQLPGKQQFILICSSIPRQSGLLTFN